MVLNVPIPLARLHQRVVVTKTMKKVLKCTVFDIQDTQDTQDIKVPYKCICFLISRERRKILRIHHMVASITKISGLIYCLQGLRLGVRQTSL